MKRTKRKDVGENSMGRRAVRCSPIVTLSVKLHRTWGDMKKPSKRNERYENFCRKTFRRNTVWRFMFTGYDNIKMVHRNIKSNGD